HKDLRTIVNCKITGATFPRRNRMSLRAGIVVLIGLFAADEAAAQVPAEPVAVALTLKDHRFTPDRLTVPAGRRIRIELANQDGALEEFDSADLGVEKD